MYKSFLVFIIALLIGLSGCDPNVVINKNYDIEDRSWNINEIPSFEFEIQNPEKRYNFYYNIRNTIEYPYNNLYVTYYLEDTLGNVISSELHNMDLFERKTGAPKGSTVLGDIYEHLILALPSFKFDTAGVYRFRMQQYMRMQELPEIVSVGLKVEVVEDSK
jgi:gliding motility-associated lipoprotein GldH